MDIVHIDFVSVCFPTAKYSDNQSNALIVCHFCSWKRI